ncbi:hypothetical protein ASE14_09320 [Agromyces sp. Root81]|uniref:hypothetical protein n=1 Tax=Agromyces sp. Root81 TaxID=1736601 RepID=UPI0006F2892B|nr:hypothetical protein [Agromyces sp. Root81]KRC61124.1 hypothetical protein ASE14_09320 [Agromyces sp. Root81]
MRTADSPPREPIEGGRYSVVITTRRTLPVGVRLNVGDLIATIVLLIPLGLATLVGMLFGAIMLMAGSCASSCTPGLVAAGALLSTAGAIAIGVLGFVYAIKRLRERRLAFGIPLLAMGGIVLWVLIGQGLASAGVG